MKLHQYQERAIEFVIKKKSAFLMMDIGLGKTAVALKVIEQMKVRAVVVAPVQVCWLTWPDEIKKWTPQLTWTVLHGKDKDTKIKRKRDIYILPYSSLKWFYHMLAQSKASMPKMLWILDESSYIKDPSTQRFKILKRLHKLILPMRMCLSATPAPNGLHELWSQYFILDNGKRLGKSFHSYRNNYFHYSGHPYYKTTIHHDGKDKIYDCIKDITFRLEAKDYLKMPPIIYNKIRLRLSPDLMEQYQELESNFFIKLNDSEIEAFNAAALSSKLRQFIAGGLYTGVDKQFEKVHTIKLALLQQLLDTNAGQPVLAVINFRFEYEMMKNRFKKPPIIYGGIKAEDKIAIINKWNKGQIPLLLAHPASMSHGLNLQAGGRIIVWMQLPWSLDYYHQLNGRLHRQGQKHAVTVNNLVFDNTIDVIVEQTLKRKHNTQKDLLDALKNYAKEM